MKKINKFLVAAPFILSIPLLSSCNNVATSSSEELDIYEKQKYTSSLEYNVWSTYGVSKVLRNIKDDSSRYFNLGKNINIDMMKNEVEGSQLIITASGDNYTYVDIAINDLRDDKGNVLNKENIKVYYQKYIVLPNNGTMNPRYSFNDYVPDLLLPFEKAKEYKENKVYGTANQGITIEVNSKGLKAGLYTGNIILQIGSKIETIPISVNVWDIEFEGRRDFKTSFLLYRSELINYEYNNSEEIVNNYVDFLNDYKVNTYVIQSVNENTVEYFKNSILRQWDNNNYSSIVIPFDFPQTYLASDASASRCISYLKALVELSIQKNENIVKYAYFYPSSYDEADLDNVKKAAAERLFSKGGELDKTIEAAINSFLSSGLFNGINEDFKNELINSVYSIPRVFTNVNFMQDWVNDYNATFCPYMSLFNDTATTQKYVSKSKENSYGDLWAYSCMAPNYPYATFHIDDDNIAMRANAWMNKKIGINGYLYYEVNKINLSNDESELVDPYDDPLRYESVAGDGYLLYPGRKYGSSYPFASVRLASYRDSMDDYDLLSILENKLNEYSSFYGINDLTLRDYIDDIYFEMFYGATLKTNEARFNELRKEIMNKIIELDDESKLLVYNSIKDNKLQTYVYSKENHLIIDGKNLSGIASNNGFIYCLDAKENKFNINVSINGKMYQKEINGLSFATNFKNSVSNLTKNENSSLSVESSFLIANIKSEYAKSEGVIDNATIRFTPYIAFPIENLDTYTGLYLNYENLSNEDVEFSVGVNNGKYNVLIETNYCPSLSTSFNHFDLTNVDSKYLKEAKEIRLYFSNVKYDNEGVASLFNDRILKIHDLVLERNK